jgi:hypothetical protein
MIWTNFNIEKVIKLLLPIIMRRFRTIEWIKALLAPIEWLKADILYRMQHDCRVIYMEKMLNEKFNTPGYDPNDHEETKVIYIDEGNTPERLWLNKSTNPDKIYLGTAYLNTTGYYNDDYSDFIIYVPSIMEPLEPKVRKYINYYKLAGKAYKIIYF